MKTLQCLTVFGRMMSGAENLIDAVNVPCRFGGIHTERKCGRMCLVLLSLPYHVTQTYS